MNDIFFLKYFAIRAVRVPVSKLSAGSKKGTLSRQLKKMILYFFLLFFVSDQPRALASQVRDNIPYQTFRDFAENRGEFSVGKKNITIKDKKGMQTGKLHTAPMPDFASAERRGIVTMISSQYAATVAHNSSRFFSTVDFGKGLYSMVDRDSIIADDFSVIRLNKLVTEVVPGNTVSSDLSYEKFNDKKRFPLFYRIGSGRQAIKTSNGTISIVSPGYRFLTGGTSGTPYLDSLGRLVTTPGKKGDNENSLLSSFAIEGDSGSPLFAWDALLNKWFVVATLSMTTADDVGDNVFSIIPPDFLARVRGKYSAEPVTSASAKSLISWHFDAVTGAGTLKQNGQEHAMQGQAGSNASQGKDLVFKDDGGTLLLQDDINQGAGALYFDGNYTVAPQAAQTWTGGGVDVARDKLVVWQVNGVKGDNLHKIGAGRLRINGKGINPGGLKVGDGTVFLAQQPDSEGRVQAFSSVDIASGRPTVVLSNARQVDPNTISWGYRGGTLDVKGNNLIFDKINAADYGAILANTAAKRADIKFRLDVGYADIPVREWLPTRQGTPGDLYVYQNGHTETTDYYVLKTPHYAWFPDFQGSNEEWEFSGHSREQAIKKIYERKKNAGYIFHGQIKGNLNLINSAPASPAGATVFDGSVAISGKFTQQNGSLVFQGHPVIHAYNDAEFAAKINDSSVKTQPVSFNQPDWERRIFRVKTLELNNAHFDLSRNATLTGDIRARRAVVTLGSALAYIDLNDGNGVINTPQKGVSVAAQFAQSSRYQGKVTLSEHSTLTIVGKFKGSITSEDSRIIVSSRNAQFDGYSQFLTTPLSLEKNAKLTARGGWLSDTNITLGPSSTLLLAGKEVKAKQVTPAFYTLTSGAEYQLQAGSTLRVSPYVFLVGDISSGNNAQVLFSGDDTISLPATLSLEDQKKVGQFAGFKNIWHGTVSAPRAQVNLTTTRWQMAEDTRLNALTLSRSLAGFSGESTTFGVLSVNDLQADKSAFVLWTDLQGSDKVVIRNLASGLDNRLFVQVEPVVKNKPEQNNLNIPLVIAPAGTNPAMFKGATLTSGFSVLTPVIEAQKTAEKTQWVLQGVTAAPNPETAKPANHFLNMSYKTFITEVNNLNKRMGELRDTQGEGGIWVRTQSGAGTGEQGYRDRYAHLQSGFDKKHRRQSANLFTGALLSYTDSRASGRGFRGNTHSFGGGLYASALFDSGAYLDLIGKYIHHQNDYQAGFAGLGQRKYATHSWYSGLEGGYRYALTPSLFVEPQAELTYGAVSGTTLKWQDKGQTLTIARKQANPLIGRVGVVVGKTLRDASGAMTLRTGLDYQFDLLANGGTVLRDASAQQRFAGKKDRRMLYHIGLDGQQGEALRFGLQLERSAFGHYNIDHAINAHLRYSF